MRLRCEFSTPVARSEVDDYVRHLVITVEAFSKDYDLIVVGKLAMDQILWNDALTDGVPLFDICDNDSQGLHEAHVILTNGHDTFRPGLAIEELTNHVMFLYGAVFHPSMWLETSGLPEADLAELGFKKIAGVALIFRHSALRTQFGDKHPQGQDADVEALPEYEEWVLREWEEFKSVAEE
jgi:hypothetical protein